MTLSLFEEFVEDVHTALAALPGGTEIEHGIGSLKKYENNAPPFIVWTPVGGSFVDESNKNTPETPQDQDPADGSVGIDAVRFQVWLWHDDLASCWDTMDRLRRASRLAIHAGNVRWRDYIVPTQTEGRWLELGQLFVLNAEFRRPMPLEIPGETQTVVVADHEFRVVDEDENVLVGNWT